jgi:hypothetical protein
VSAVHVRERERARVCVVCDDDGDDGDSLSGAKLTKVQSPPPPSSHHFLFTFAPGCAILPTRCDSALGVLYVLIKASGQFRFVDDKLIQRYKFTMYIKKEEDSHLYFKGYS